MKQNVIEERISDLKWELNFAKPYQLLWGNGKYRGNLYPIQYIYKKMFYKLRSNENNKFENFILKKFKKYFLQVDKKYIKVGDVILTRYKDNVNDEAHFMVYVGDNRAIHVPHGLALQYADIIKLKEPFEVYRFWG